MQSEPRAEQVLQCISKNDLYFELWKSLQSAGTHKQSRRRAMGRFHILLSQYKTAIRCYAYKCLIVYITSHCYRDRASALPLNQKIKPINNTSFKNLKQVKLSLLFFFVCLRFVCACQHLEEGRAVSLESIELLKIWLTDEEKPGPLKQNTNKQKRIQSGQTLIAHIAFCKWDCTFSKVSIFGHQVEVKIPFAAVPLNLRVKCSKKLVESKVLLT